MTDSYVFFPQETAKVFRRNDVVRKIGSNPPLTPVILVICGCPAGSSRPVLVILESIHSCGTNDVESLVIEQQDAREGRSPPPIYGL